MSSFSKYVGNGAQTVYAVNQPMPSYSALEVSLDGAVATAGFIYNRTNATVTFAVAPADGVVVKLSRITQVEPIHKFATGAAFTARNVDTNFTQESYRVEELQDNVAGVKELEESVLQAAEDAQAVLDTLTTDYVSVGTFAAGYDALQHVKQTLRYSDGHDYGWTGTFPKKVEPGESPTPLGAGEWIDRSDVMLRGELADDASAVEIGASTAGNLGKRTAGAVFVTESPYNADPTGVVDSTAAINAALATGKNVYGAGIFKVSGPLTMNGFGQKLYINFPGSYLLPYHDGDVVRMTLHSQGAHVVIRGRDALGNLTQPRTGTEGGAIVIGYNGGNCMTASVAGSYVHTFYGNGYVHEQGAMVDFTGAHAENCTIDGFQWTPNYNDNNHSLINTTHAINCGRDGYSLLSTGNLVDDYNPRHHQFLNAKAFGCQRNFNIETHGNVGTVFSELGVTPDRFGPLAYANEISVFETTAAFLSWQDLGTRNTLYGIDTYGNWTARQQFSRKSIINSGHEGYLEISQSGDRAFSNAISGTSGSVSVTHGRGSAASRVDAFESIQILSGGGGISHIKTGSFSVSPGSIAANSSYSASVSPGEAGAAAGDSLIVTMSNASTFSELTVSGYLHTNGQAIIFIRNPTGAAINPGAVTIRWVVMRH